MSGVRGCEGDRVHWEGVVKLGLGIMGWVMGGSVHVCYEKYSE